MCKKQNKILVVNGDFNGQILKPATFMCLFFTFMPCLFSSSIVRERNGLDFYCREPRWIFILHNGKTYWNLRLLCHFPSTKNALYLGCVWRRIDCHDNGYSNKQQMWNVYMCRIWSFTTPMAYQLVWRLPFLYTLASMVCSQ